MQAPAWPARGRDDVWRTTSMTRRPCTRAPGPLVAAWVHGVEVWRLGEGCRVHVLAWVSGTGACGGAGRMLSGRAVSYFTQ